MAEKPRLKKSDEILGSIVAEPARASRRSASRRFNQQESERRAAPGPEILPEPDDEGFELSEPSLPSAQTLAEKLMANDNKRRLNFEKYELPRRGQPVEATASIEIPSAPLAASVDIPSKPATASMDIPAPRRPAAREPAPTAAPTPVQEAESPEAQAPVSYGQNTAPVVMEYTFQAFEDEGDHPVREFQMARDGDSRPESRRSVRERARKSTKQDAAEPETERQTAPRQRNAEPQPEPREALYESAPQNAAPPASRPEPAFEPEPSYEIEQPAPSARDGAEPQPEPREVLYESARKQAAASPAPRPEPAAPPSPEPEDPAAVEERNRREFLDRIASQFERQFGEKFEDGILQPRDAAKKPAAPASPRRESIFDRPAAPRAAAKPFEEPRAKSASRLTEPAPDEDFFTTVQRQERERRAMGLPSLREADPGESSAQDFIAKFQNDVKSEEKQRSEDFKETLAEKFMRERERYLKELGITVQESGPEPERGDSRDAPRRRKLDFQIQPEMHVGEGETVKPRASAPVTYTRGAVTKPQIPHEEDELSSLRATPAGTRKTSEQLLMEHGRLTRAIAPQPRQTQKQPAQLKFTFETPEEQAKKQKQDKPDKGRESLLPKEKWPRRIVIISMVSGLLAIALLAWPLLRYMQFSRNPANSGESSASVSALVEDTLDVYENRSYEQTAKANNVVFKNANVTLKNVDVDDYVVIEGIESKGKIRLEDMKVNAAVYVRSSGIDTLELHNVKAGRVIINNSSADVTVNATGTTDIGVVEIRTPAVVRQSELAGDSPGVRDMVITGAESGGTVNAKLDGLSLATLNTEATDSVLTYENNTRVETMSSDGSLSLSGSGKVVNLSIGAKTALGAGGNEGAKSVSLVVKGVTITNLNVKSPADINIATDVDSVATSSAVAVNGSGSIGTFTLNPDIGAAPGRLLADISDVNVQRIYSNTQSRINIMGSARVAALVADASTYVLGNKVNQLTANSNDVIYEIEPDNIAVATGIDPPQSKADNPDIDYDVAGVAHETADDSSESSESSESEVADSGTACGHSAESGGFLAGSGSSDAPYEVSTPLQLAHISQHLDSHFIQTAAIDIATESKLSSNFTMIGSGNAPFAGVYDGMGLAISHLVIASSDENVGLFAVNKGIIRNVLLISGSVTSNATRQAYVGGIAGLNLDGGAIRASSNGATVSGNQHTYTGGIAGYNFNAKVHDCFNYARISGFDTVGGLVGMNRQSATLTGSYNAGTVEGRDEVGSVAGKNENATIANCYFLLETADFGIGDGGGTAIEKTSDELQDAQMAADLSAGNENSLWIAGQTSVGGYTYPMHKKPQPSGP